MDLMLKLINMKVIILGMRGLGIEISKNIILSGINTLSIFDDTICSISDLNSNFYITEKDINIKRRDEACLMKLKDLNPNVKINLLDSLEIVKNNITNYDILVATEIFDIETLINLNDICRENNVKFIYTSVLGLSGFIFNDFGEHIIINKTGSEPQTFLIKNITKEKEGIVTIDIENETNSLYDISDYVIFKNIKGMTELNETEPVKIKVLSAETFSIGDTRNNKDYISGGMVKEINIPIKKKFQSLKDCLYEPFSEGLLGQSINMKKGKKELYHVCLCAIHHFLSIHNYLPEINNDNHIREIIKIVKLLINFGKNKEFIKKIKSIDEKYLENIIRWCKCSISPICSFLGGIVSQEIFKINGKYNPISQWLYFDFFEKLESLDSNRITKSINSRYNEQISIFGQDFQEKLSNLNIFMIGAGALGCEFLKIFALMGIGSKNNRYISVTDNDNIELSNLNRQFLFRKKHQGKNKAIISCEEAKKINENINFKSYDLKVLLETENIFNDCFWEDQDLIISAVDNENARKYIDNQITFYNKIFLESGTSGTSASSMVIYPQKTICYDDLEKTISKDIPMCTLKSFPSQIEHCVEYSKMYTSELFEKNIEDLNSFIENEESFLNGLDESFTEKKDLYEKLKELNNILLLYKNKNKNDLIEYSLEKYNIFFKKNIEELITRIPDYSLNEKGEPFWRGAKIMPHPITFDIKDELSKNFIFYFCTIYNRILKLNLDINEKEILKINEKKIENDNNKNAVIEYEKEIYRLKSEIIELKNTIDFNNVKFLPEKFEKDNDDNFQLDFIYCFSNLRARNYNIAQCDREKVRRIAGNIIPAIAATTACIAGFVAIQLYSVLISDDISFFRNIGLDLGTSWYSTGIPEEVRKYKEIKIKNENSNSLNEKYSVWDSIKVKGPLTAKQIIDLFKNEYNVEIDYINSNEECIIDLIEDENEENFDKTIDELYKEKFKDNIEMRKYLKLTVLGTQNNVNIKLPRIKYIL
jgi:ubiquitin-activating enzyme E1